MKDREATGWFQPLKQRPKYVTTMICLETDCGHLWDARRISDPCPKCGSNSVVPADNWNFGSKGCLKLGKAVS
jgi:rubrerythrin